MSGDQRNCMISQFLDTIGPLATLHYIAPLTPTLIPSKRNQKKRKKEKGKREKKKKEEKTKN